MARVLLLACVLVQPMRVVCQNRTHIALDPREIVAKLVGSLHDQFEITLKIIAKIVSKPAFVNGR